MTDRRKNAPSVYGNCMACGSNHIARQRSPDGNTMCRDCGHSRPHAQWQEPVKVDSAPEGYQDPKGDAQVLREHLSNLRKNLARAYGDAASVAALAEGHMCHAHAELAFEKLGEVLKSLSEIKPDAE